MVASRNVCNKQNSENSATTSSSGMMINKSHKLKAIKGNTSRPMLTPLVIEKKYKQKAVPVYQPIVELTVGAEDLNVLKDETTCSFFFVEDKIQTVDDSCHDDFIIVM
ncbi:predicted protein [Naegleria gruberi]|uniref:Predicted protein n=1 Tax=Naegleria gruberi TaxID=5762 RepID=D2W3H1_NAEGR|nr:uncharacterized protein NAEGRDRAFT_75942 [Naegleria gruberi]EFC36384.1 predicted protein [Naegleria gruberi]|eukprot:XP_002669128.1 predicted protein [Naegleria gruberi strain NEG-M]